MAATSEKKKQMIDTCQVFRGRRRSRHEAKIRSKMHEMREISKLKFFGFLHKLRCHFEIEICLDILLPHCVSRLSSDLDLD